MTIWEQQQEYKINKLSYNQTNQTSPSLVIWRKVINHTLIDSWVEDTALRRCDAILLKAELSDCRGGGGGGGSGIFDVNESLFSS